ncbi:MAG: bacillithiol biosynthesis BshC, partial [Acidobacteriota bacterium]
DPATKPLAREIFAREVQFPALTAELAAASGRALVGLGYHAQVEAHLDSLALFSLDRGRVAIHVEDGSFRFGDRRVDMPALLASVRAEPEKFSPNVLLRPLVQDALFPTVAYVAGPNELAYLGQLKDVYAHFGVPMPLMCPRASATLLDTGAARFLARYDIPLEVLQAHDERALNDLLESQLPPSVERALREAAAAVESHLQEVIQAVPAIDPTLEGAARSVLGRMSHDLHGLHTKVIHAAKKRDETLRRQFSRAQAQAFPGGHAQERAVGFVHFLNRHGSILVDRLLSELPLDLGRHWVLSL